MKRITLFLLLIVLFSNNLFSNSNTTFGTPVKYICGYLCDLDMDEKIDDIVVYMQGKKDYLLFALLKEKKDYRTFILSKTKRIKQIRIKYGPVVEKNSKKNTNKMMGWKGKSGPYIAIHDTKSIIESFCWNGNSFDKYQMDYSVKYEYDGEPLKYLSGYEYDLNLDGINETIIYLQINRKYLVIGLFKEKNTYISRVISESDFGGVLVCEFANTITSYENELVKIYACPGPFISIIYPPSAAVSYFWDKGKFNEIWTSD